MHTILVITAGLLLGIVFGLLGYLWGTPAGAAFALLAFCPAWLVFTAINMWIGVNRAGYSIAQELPIQAVVLLMPVTLAFAASRLLVR